MSVKTLKCSLVCLLCVSLTVLTSCGNDSQNNNTVNNTTSTNYSVPLENRNEYFAVFDVCPSSTSDGYYRVNTAAQSLWYYDAQTGKGMFLCAQSGCMHNDETCQAWIGDVSLFTEYHGNILAIRTAGGDAELIKKNISSGEIEVLNKWKNSDTESFNINIGRVADNKILLYVDRYINNGQGQEIYVEGERTIWIYSLETGEMQQMFSGENAKDLGVWAISGKYVLVRYWHELSEEEFYEKYGEDADYDAFNPLTENRELRLYDVNLGTYSLITDTENGGWIPCTDKNYIYENRVIFQCGDTLYLLDLSSGQATEFFTMENIINYWLMDHKAFFIAAEEEDQARFYYMDIDDRTLVELENDGNTEVMAFSMIDEGESFFISSGSMPKIISKEDFYAERYDNARTL